MRDPAASARASALLDYLAEASDHPYARVVGFSASDGVDVVDLVVEPELPQHRLVRIEAEEPVRVVFDRTDASAPTVHATRPSFPIDLVHTVREATGDGRCLCVWEEGWADLRRNLTPQALVERIREWLARTARGTLHQEGQSVEPLIPAVADTLVLPPGEPPTEWRVVQATERRRRWVVSLGAAAAGQAPFAVFSMRLPVQVHGSLRSAPSDMDDLRGIVRDLGGDLVEALGAWLVERAQIEGPERRALLILSIPMSRADGATVDGWETWAFMSSAPLRELGTRVGRMLHDPGTGALGLRLVRGPVDLTGVELLRWRVVRRLDRAAARAHAGRADSPDQALVAVGAGAIGSNVVVNTARAGIGTWTVIDGDVVMPHNTVRQVQGDADVGSPKAESTRRFAARLLADQVAEAIDADVLSPGEAAPAVERVYAAADLVVDFSASPAVLGHLAGHPAVRRAASMFFGPDGRDLVVLAEDSDRAVRLDEAEAQYFLAAATDPALAGHLAGARLDLVRYGNACQDLSRPLPPWQVQALCGLASGQVAALATQHGAHLGVWRLDPGTGAVAALSVEVEPVRRIDGDGVRLTLSDRAARRMRELRRAALPHETGGVLVGTFDLDRAVMHVVDALPAPPDSLQAPTYFVRGKRELEPTVTGLAIRSAGALGYLGEWHSHPRGASIHPSPDDENVWAHLDAHLGPPGEPHAMMIVGDDGTFARVGWRPHRTFEGELAHGG